jgi:hypothetical protein
LNIFTRCVFMAFEAIPEHVTYRDCRTRKQRSGPLEEVSRS